MALGRTSTRARKMYAPAVIDPISSTTVNPSKDWRKSPQTPTGCTGPGAWASAGAAAASGGSIAHKTRAVLMRAILWGQRGRGRLVEIRLLGVAREPVRPAE